ncbi:trimeric intracellular cation channel family protein [Corynebacterium kroppenstedtii]|uniref:trimeric intracellular cation channel family protein n=1 Tax=Corynebacterium sp. PCR 32 TaxID=3351342 RepID=UPI0030A521EB
MDIVSVYRIIDLTGVFLNGILGGAIARRRQFDAIGFGLLAILSGLGGGLLRDTLLQKGLPAALKEPMYLGVALAGGLVAMTVSLEREQWNKILKIGDGIVLGVWSVTGTIKALDAGLMWPSAILLGMITAVGGGMIRDVTIGVVPAIFGGNTLYATSALLGSGVMVLFNGLGLQTVGMVVSASCASMLSIVAYFRGWGLPNNPDWAPVTMTAGQLRRLMLTRAMVEPHERLARKQRRKLRRWKDDGGP